ncbi:26S proteasome non-ATPase regulatory subunit 14 [Hordeum vulgare]|nr:26S proteasome non-ATPase regulatory subunit 14 [Hordeum vulgare]
MDNHMLAGLPALPPAADAALPDSSEQIYIAPVALLKMLTHARAGVPMEVMGLMLGEFVDEYTVTVVDVFAMPQSGTGVSVEAIDDAFQTGMMGMLRQTGRPEMVVGWYHSHPGFGCWLSATDIQTQLSFEQLNPRAVAVVLDPIQSVRGKVVMDAFRLINPTAILMRQEPRQTTSNVGATVRPSLDARIQGLGVHYYSLVIGHRQNEVEEGMLACLNRSRWSHGLVLPSFDDDENEAAVSGIRDLAVQYDVQVREEDATQPERLAVVRAGRPDAKKQLGERAEAAMSGNIVHTLGMMLDTVAF